MYACRIVPCHMHVHMHEVYALPSSPVSPPSFLTSFTPFLPHQFHPLPSSPVSPPSSSPVSPPSFLTSFIPFLPRVSPPSFLTSFIPFLPQVSSPSFLTSFTPFLPQVSPPSFLKFHPLPSSSFTPSSALRWCDGQPSAECSWEALHLLPPVAWVHYWCGRCLSYTRGESILQQHRPINSYQAGPLRYVPACVCGGGGFKTLFTYAQSIHMHIGTAEV